MKVDTTLVSPLSTSGTTSGSGSTSGPSANSGPSVNSGPGSSNGNGNGKDKVKPAKTPAPSAPTLSGGMTMAAVWASQAERRETERAAAAAAKAKTREFVPAGTAPDSKKAALRLMEDTSRIAETRRAEAAKAAEKRQAEKKPKEDPFAPKADDPFAPREDRPDPFAPEPSATAAPPRISPALQSYQSVFAPREAESGTTLDARF